MFNVGPIELFVVFIVALLVIGPERLPGTVKTCSLWIGRLRRNFHKIKSEIEQELNADEIRRQVYNESVLEEFSNAQKQVNSLVKDAGDEIVGEGPVKKTGEAENQDTKLIEEAAKSNAIANPVKVPAGRNKSVLSELKDVAAELNEAGKQIDIDTKQIAQEINSPNVNTKKETKQGSN